MCPGNGGNGSVGPVHPNHPTLTAPQVLAAHGLAELPLGMTWKKKADRLGLDVLTLRRYRVVPEFQELVIQIARQNLRLEVPGAYRALIKGMHAGGSGGAKYLELFFKITGEISDQEQVNALKGWLDAVSACSSDMLVVAIQRTASRATGGINTPGSRVMAPEASVAQGARMELTGHIPPAPPAVRGELEL